MLTLGGPPAATCSFGSPIGTCRFFLKRRVVASRIEFPSVISTGEDFKMKAFVAACIAAGILWGVDFKLNGGRYSAVQNVIVGAIPR